MHPATTPHTRFCDITEVVFWLFRLKLNKRRAWSTSAALHPRGGGTLCSVKAVYLVAVRPRGTTFSRRAQHGIERGLPLEISGHRAQVRLPSVHRICSITAYFGPSEAHGNDDFDEKIGATRKCRSGTLRRRHAEISFRPNLFHRSAWKLRHTAVYTERAVNTG